MSNVDKTKTKCDHPGCKHVAKDPKKSRLCKMALVRNGDGSVYCEEHQLVHFPKQKVKPLV